MSTEIMQMLLEKLNITSEILACNQGSKPGNYSPTPELYMHHFVFSKQIRLICNRTANSAMAL